MGLFLPGREEERAKHHYPHPPALPNKQVWEIIVNVKGIKKASACVRVCKSCQVNTAAYSPDSSKIDYLPQRSL